MSPAIQIEIIRSALHKFAFNSYGTDPYNTDTDDDTALPDPLDVDDDGDGQTENQGDCDDSNAEIYTGADETCDGVDNNCSGDESDATDLSTWYADTDGDTYGDDADADDADDDADMIVTILNANDPFGRKLI